MSEDSPSLAGSRVLILEDDYYLAADMRDVLQSAGAVVIGPFGDEPEARRALAEDRPGCAFIDVNLGRGPSFEVPSTLFRSDVPFAFVTGYDASSIPDEFSAILRLEKPVEARIVVEMASRLLRSG